MNNADFERRLQDEYEKRGLLMAENERLREALERLDAIFQSWEDKDMMHPTRLRELRTIARAAPRGAVVRSAQDIKATGAAWITEAELSWLCDQASENERLREALERIVMLDDPGDDTVSDYVAIARAALGERP